MAGPDTRPYVLFLGRLAPNKAPGNLVEAMARLPEGTHLVMAGPPEDGALAAALKARVRELGLEGRVRFIGAVHGARKRALLAGAELLVLPSHAENFGLVVLEALREGTPVVASRGTPWRELVEHRCGYWVPGDPASLARAVSEHLRLPRDERRAMGERGRALVAERYRIDRVAARHAELLASLD